MVFDKYEDRGGWSRCNNILSIFYKIFSRNDQKFSLPREEKDVLKSVPYRMIFMVFIPSTRLMVHIPTYCCKNMESHDMFDPRHMFSISDM